MSLFKEKKKLWQPLTPGKSIDQNILSGILCVSYYMLVYSEHHAHFKKLWTEVMRLSHSWCDFSHKLEPNIAHQCSFPTNSHSEFESC